MGCKCAGKYWKAGLLPHSIYCLRNALSGTLSDPEKRTMPFLSFCNSNELLSSASANIYMADPTEPWLFAFPAGVGCHQKVQTIRFQGASLWLACKPNGERTAETPPFWLSLLTRNCSIYLSAHDEGLACPACLLRAPVAAFAQWTSSKEVYLLQHCRSIRNKTISVSSVHLLTY